MKRFLMITLTAITAVALVTAPGWAAGGRKLSDRQLANVHAGNHVSDASNADSTASAEFAGDLFIAGAASSAAAATASDVASALAVKINNKCAAGFCKLKVETEAEDSGSSVTTNTQSILNTLASVNAVQVNVVGGTGGTQTNTAYSAEGAIGEIDSAENGAAAASADIACATSEAFMTREGVCALIASRLGNGCMAPAAISRARSRASSWARRRDASRCSIRTAMSGFSCTS